MALAPKLSGASSLCLHVTVLVRTRPSFPLDSSLFHTKPFTAVYTVTMAGWHPNTLILKPNTPTFELQVRLRDPRAYTSPR